MKVSILMATAPLFGIFLASNAPAAAQTSGQDAAAADEDDPDQRVRCRSRRVTGSNARRIRTCMTIAEWEELASTGNRDARLVLDETTRDAANRN